MKKQSPLTFDFVSALLSKIDGSGASKAQKTECVKYFIKERKFMKKPINCAFCSKMTKYK